MRFNTIGLIGYGEVGKIFSAGLEARGAHYVEAGVMTSVPPYGIKTPMLLGGPLAAELAVLCAALGMTPKPSAKKSALPAPSKCAAA